MPVIVTKRLWCICILILLKWVTCILNAKIGKKWKKCRLAHRSYHIYSKYSDRQAWAKNMDPEEMLSAVSHQCVHRKYSKQYRPRWDTAEYGVSSGLCCSPLIQQFLDKHRVVNCTCSNFRSVVVRNWDVRILRVNTVKCQLISTLKGTGYTFMGGNLGHNCFRLLSERGLLKILPPRGANSFQVEQILSFES